MISDERLGFYEDLTSPHPHGSHLNRSQLKTSKRYPPSNPNRRLRIQRIRASLPSSYPLAAVEHDPVASFVGWQHEWLNKHPSIVQLSTKRRSEHGKHRKGLLTERWCTEIPDHESDSLVVVDELRWPSWGPWSLIPRGEVTCTFPALWWSS
jgi:hypothetical protein